MSMREGLIVAGIVILLVVIADLIRRYIKRDKLRLAIDDKFKDLPDIDLSSELPNGGARVLDSGESLPVTSAFDGSDQRDVVNPKTQRMDSRPETALDSRSEPESWVIDPILSSVSSQDEEVDLLLEQEFKGVGEGADQWLSQTAQLPEQPGVSEQEPRVELDQETDPEPPVEQLFYAEGAAVEAAIEVEPQSISSEVEVPVVEALVAEKANAAADEPVTAEAESSVNPLGLVENNDHIDLGRPVHELLQAREQAETVSQGAAEEVIPESFEASESDVSAALAEPLSVAKPATPSAQKTKSKPKAKAKPKHQSRAEEQPSFFDLHPDLAPEVELPKPKPKSRRRRKKAEQVEVVATTADSETAVEDEVLIINVQAKQQPFAAAMLFKLIEACGLEFGAMDIFHRHEEAKGQGPMQFSMANAVAPGTFDPSSAEPLATPAVTFFLRLSDPTDRMNALECMLATAQCVADNLGGELKDENRSSLRTQTIEHYRQKVREYERKQLTRRA
ncbi:MAG: cell division protein ZipA [Halopseudomonas sp.]